MSKRVRVPLLKELARRFPEIGSPEAAIAAGRVLVDGSPASNIAAQVARDASIRVLPERELRGMAKLGEALDRFQITCSELIALDIGAASGGFTKALLDRGARRVYAVDVGHGQLLGGLRHDPRVVNLERTNVSSLSRDLVPDTIDVVAIDVSYLSLSDAFSAVNAAGLRFSAGARLAGLVKPMFELRLDSLPSADIAPRALDVAIRRIDSLGWRVDGSFESSVGGAGGAIEYLVVATCPTLVCRNAC